MKILGAASKRLVVCPAAVVLPGGTRSTPAREARYEVVVKKDVTVPMRGGVRLATDVYLPAKGGTALGQKLMKPGTVYQFAIKL